MGSLTNTPKQVKVVYCSGKRDFGIQGEKNCKEWNVNVTLHSGKFSYSYDYTLDGPLRMEFYRKKVKEISLLILSRVELICIFLVQCPRNSFHSRNKINSSYL